MTYIKSLNKLVERNEYPIIFVGSGITKRYLKNYPSWIDLLEEMWKKLNNNIDFYAYLNQTRNSLKEKYEQENLDYITYIKIGTEIKRMFDKKFYESKITIENFNQKSAFYSKIPPFKKALSLRFSTYEYKDEMLEEIKFFKKLLHKSQVILTTNYDTFIEDCYGEKSLKKYIGQKGFFQHHSNWAELFKIHGCVEDPNSLIITESDYDAFNQNSVLISAKIISLLINSPIIFIGYSLTDMNIRKIIRDFANSLTGEQKELVKDRLIIVNRKRGAEGFIEYQKVDDDLGCTFTVIETDNYLKLYQILLKINQGVFPSEVRRFQDLIKKLIVERGKKGNLKSLLISPIELEKLEEKITDENIVVALGDTTYIFKLPDLMTFLDDFINGNQNIPTDIALKFITMQAPNARIPIYKYLREVDLEETSLNNSEKDKIYERIERFSDLSSCIDTINVSYKIEYSSLKEILNEQFREEKELDVISYNIGRLDISEVWDYFKLKFKRYKSKGNTTVSTAFRRLALILDIVKYK